MNLIKKIRWLAKEVRSTQMLKNAFFEHFRRIYNKEDKKVTILGSLIEGRLSY